MIWPRCPSDLAQERAACFDRSLNWLSAGVSICSRHFQIPSFKRSNFGSPMTPSFPKSLRLHLIITKVAITNKHYRLSAIYLGQLNRPFQPTRGCQGSRSTINGIQARYHRAHFQSNELAFPFFRLYRVKSAPLLYPRQSHRIVHMAPKLDLRKP